MDMKTCGVFRPNGHWTIGYGPSFECLSNWEKKILFIPIIV